MKDVVTKSDELDRRIQTSPADINASIEALVRASKINRRLIYWVIASLIFETVLAIAVISTVIKTNNNTVRINQNHQTIVNNCTIGNEFRNTEKSLWTYILSIPSDTTPTPDQQKKVDAFKVYLDKAFAARDCSKL